MKNSFFNKITFERKVVEAVNSTDSRDAQLPGLSQAAIATWERRTNRHNASELGDQLRRLGRLCQTLSDRSHESFRQLHPNTEAAIDDGLAVLRSTLSSSKG